MPETLEKFKSETGELTPRRKAESPPELRSPKEEVLASREKSSSKKIGMGITDSSFVELKDDGKGVFKTELYSNERAAYLIDRFLGINLTPPTTIRDLDGETGSMQEFIPDAKMYAELRLDEESNEEEHAFVEKHKEEFMRMWVFDMIIGNLDRHGGNFLFSGDDLYAIDHGHSLSKNEFEYFSREVNTYSRSRNFLDQELPVSLVKSIKNFIENSAYQQILEDLLEELFGQEVAAICLKRTRVVGKLIVEKGKISHSDTRGYDKIIILE